MEGCHEPYSASDVMHVAAGTDKSLTHHGRVVGGFNTQQRVHHEAVYVGLLSAGSAKVGVIEGADVHVGQVEDVAVEAGQRAAVLVTAVT